MRTLFALAYLTASAAADPLTGSQIAALISGNTTVGLWHGAPYRQSFRTDGTTIYAQQGSRSSLGHWRITETSNTFETLWPNEDWTAYGVDRTGTTLSWIDAAGTLHPFDIETGENLTWPEN